MTQSLISRINLLYVYFLYLRNTYTTEPPNARINRAGKNCIKPSSLADESRAIPAPVE
jgi:hypothetical protein